jgi:hypothetical protein
MVPVGRSRFVALHDGAGVTVTNLNPLACTLTEIRESQLPSDERASSSAGDRYFRIEGRAKGGALLMATGGSLIPLFLEVAVKEKRQQLIAFNFLRDNAGHRTTRPAANVGQWMPTLNYIWRRQANVELVNHGIRTPRIAQNLGATIRVPADNSLDATFNLIGSAGDSSVDLNVFCVWVLQQTGSTGDLDAFTSIGTAGSGSPGTCQALAEALTDESYDIRGRAASALYWRCDRSAAAKFTAQLCR